MYGLAVFLRHVLFHLFPDVVRNGNTVTVEVHTERGNHIGLGAKANGRPQGLPGKHMRAIQFTVDHPIQQNFPVSLRFERHI